MSRSKKINKKDGQGLSAVQRRLFAHISESFWNRANLGIMTISEYFRICLNISEWQQFGFWGFVLACALYYHCLRKLYVFCNGDMEERFVKLQTDVVNE